VNRNIESIMMAEGTEYKYRAEESFRIRVELGVGLHDSLTTYTGVELGFGYVLYKASA
jgi:hypothetical protein